MKRIIISPALSAFVIPGMGQIVNGQVAKGSILLGLVAMVMVLAVFLLLQSVTQALYSLPEPEITRASMEKVVALVSAQDNTALYILTVAFIAIWAYAVVDAFFVARKLDRNPS